MSSRYVSEEEAMDMAVDSFRLSIPDIAEKYSRKPATVKRALIGQVEFIELLRDSIRQSKITAKVEEATELQRLELIAIKKKVIFAERELDDLKKK